MSDVGARVLAGGALLALTVAVVVLILCVPWRGRTRRTPALWLAGADLKLLGDNTHDRAILTSMGSMVGVIALLSGASVTIAGSIILDRSRGWLYALPAGLIWAFAVLQIDRWITSTMDTPKSRSGWVAFVGSRLALTLVVGGLISELLSMKIFAPEIADKLNQIHQKQFDTVDAPAVYAAHKEHPLDGRLRKGQTLDDVATNYDPTGAVPRAKEAWDTAETFANLKTQQLTCEKNPTNTCKTALAKHGLAVTGDRDTSKNADGPDTRKRRSEANAARATADRLHWYYDCSGHRPAGTSAKTDCATNVKAATAAAFQASLNPDLKVAHDKVFADKGLLSQEDALWQVVRQHPVTWLWRIFIALSFMLIDLIPLIFKLTSPVQAYRNAYQSSLTTRQNSLDENARIQEDQLDDAAQERLATGKRRAANQERARDVEATERADEVLTAKHRIKNQGEVQRAKIDSDAAVSRARLAADRDIALDHIARERRERLNADRGASHGRHGTHAGHADPGGKAEEDAWAGAWTDARAGADAGAAAEEAEAVNFTKPEERKPGYVFEDADGHGAARAWEVVAEVATGQGSDASRLYRVKDVSDPDDGGENFLKHTKGRTPGTRQNELAFAQKLLAAQDSLTNRYIAKVLDAHLDGDELWVVHPMYEGSTSDLLFPAGGDQLTLLGAVEYWQNLVEGITLGWTVLERVHCDVKAANACFERIDGTPEPRWVDWEDSTGLDGKVELADRRTDGTGSMIGIGTLGYRAPEQRDGRKRSVATDVHALGALLYYMLSGSQIDTELDDRPSLKLAAERMPMEVVELVDRWVSVTPEDRIPGFKMSKLTSTGAELARYVAEVTSQAEQMVAAVRQSDRRSMPVPVE
ncbi:DUF4407 domain-containing protein [uncultured Jatrophihabitans sp.]|uniref:DUF4407 domain-containing protein n=1 Tax=uncultured Jatrophihabitans sp. TaxID=1610747 RepID=UPI0035CB0DB8